MKDKIIFWLNADLTYFGIAKSLQEKYDSNFYAIIDITEKPKNFFITQKLVKFQKTWFLHDHIKKNHKPDLNYLKSFEQKYKINLWLLAQNERFFYKFNQFYKFTEEEILSILEQECRLFESILDESKPDFLIMGVSTLHHNHLFYEICKSRDIRVLMLRSTPFGYRYMISSGPENIDDFGIVEKPTKVRTMEELNDYLRGHDSFKQGLQYLNTFQKSKVHYVAAALTFLFSANNNEKTHYTYYGRLKLRVLFKILISIIKKRYRERFMNKNFLNTIETKSPFVYFPLHLEEERVLLIGAPFYTNQIEIIRHIAKSLPVGYTLFVKEHPMMNIRNWRSISDYKTMLDIPNVKVFHPSVKSDVMIKNCSLVVTVNGTSSLESAFYGKPSVVFSDIDFSSLPFIFRVKAIETLPQIIGDSLQAKVDTVSLNEYVDLIDRNSFEFDLQGLFVKMHNYFQYGGFLVDVEISDEKMKSFLNAESKTFEKLSSEHIKIINHYKKCNTK